MDVIIKYIDGTHQHWKATNVAAVDELYDRIENKTDPKVHRILKLFVSAGNTLVENVLGPERKKERWAVSKRSIRKMQGTDFLALHKLYLQSFVFLNETTHPIEQIDLSDALIAVLGDDVNFEQIARLDFTSPDPEKVINEWFDAFLKKRKIFKIDALRKYENLWDLHLRVERIFKSKSRRRRV